MHTFKFVSLTFRYACDSLDIKRCHRERDKSCQDEMSPRAVIGISYKDHITNEEDRKAQAFESCNVPLTTIRRSKLKQWEEHLNVIQSCQLTCARYCVGREKERQTEEGVER